MAKTSFSLCPTDNYNENILLSQRIPCISQDDLNIIKKYIQESITDKNISNIKIVISRNLYLIKNKNILSFSSISLKDKNLTFYISQYFLKELNKKSYLEKKYLLKQLIIYTIDKYLNSKIKNFFNFIFLKKTKGQQDLTNFIKSIFPNIIQIRNSLFDIVNLLLTSDNISSVNKENTIAILYGNLLISSFEKAFKLYQQGKISKLFVSGNERGALSIITKLRNSKYAKNISKHLVLSNLTSINSIEDILSLTNEAYNEILNQKIKIYISEAEIIKWIILKCGQFANMTKKEILLLEKNIIIETKASNTLQNTKNVFNLKEFKNFIESRKSINIILIQAPFSQLRTKVTLNKVLAEQDIKAFTSNKRINSYISTIDISPKQYRYNNVRALTLALLEVTRLIAYALKKDIIPVFDNKGSQSILFSSKFIFDILNLLPIMNDIEKTNLHKIFQDVAKQEPNFKYIENILSILRNHVSEINKYNLLSYFIKYLYADINQQLQLEKDWSNKIYNQNFTIFDPK